MAAHSSLTSRKSFGGARTTAAMAAVKAFEDAGGESEHSEAGESGVWCGVVWCSGSGRLLDFEIQKTCNGQRVLDVGATEVVTSVGPAIALSMDDSFLCLCIGTITGNVGDEVGTGEHLPTSVHCSTPAGVGDGLFEDPDDDDVEPDLITDDSGDDLGASDPRGAAAYTTIHKSSKEVRSHATTGWNSCPMTSPDKGLLILDLVLLVIRGWLCRRPRLDMCGSGR
ncbi:hypothetical protein Ahy_A07g033234 [Arachis hypogaea]|uniref:Uncharacterized protein n=1 Tax=Arachis hypogaea TaxID=3818 RepID=A0A445C8K4_ARAHY|nr:hypothetical protein Ahy_A07g033234 [Arachis hypogaea]